MEEWHAGGSGFEPQSKRVFFSSFYFLTTAPLDPRQSRCKLLTPTVLKMPKSKTIKKNISSHQKYSENILLKLIPTYFISSGN